MRWLCLAAFALAVRGWSTEWSAEHGRHYYFNAKDGEASWTPPPASSEAATSTAASSTTHEGWFDCTHDARSVFGAGGLQRAWRKMARDQHPDKGGSSGGFQSLTETRDFLRSPMRFFAYRM